MVFKCQEDSFLKEFTSEVISCEKAEFNTVGDSGKVSIDGYKVILKDTILFPEGGGQPSDRGQINGKTVYFVERKADQAVHYVKEPLEIGEKVLETVDWNRRFDHMQQHSGQHLITAVLERDFKIGTVSWYLGEESAYIELDVPAITDDQISSAEVTCNELIRNNVKVTVQIYDQNTPSSDLDSFRSVRGLPADYKGDIRVVTIDGIESNMCCGTHVTNLSQLQVVKLLHWEKSKRKNQILLHFLIGNRVIKRLGAAIDREQKLNNILKTNPTQHVEFVDKLLQQVKTSNKNLQIVLRDLAINEVNKLKANPPKYFILHRKEAEADFMNTFIRELGRTDILLFLSIGDEKGEGNIVLYGEENIISELGNKICDMLEGKGAKKGNRFQAKVLNMSKRKEAVKLIEDYFK